MPRVVRTLWFEELSFLHEPFFDTPLGKLTLRQMLILLVSGGSAWTAALLTADMMLKLFFGASVFIVGLTIAFQKVRTVSPEMTLLLMLSIPKPSLARPGGKGGTTSQPVEAKALSIPAQDIENISPVKVIGILKDPATGRPIVKRAFEVFVDEKSYAKGGTDGEGFFTVFFLPDSYGSFKIEVRPEGFPQPLETVVVNVQPGDAGTQRSRQG